MAAISSTAAHHRARIAGLSRAIRNGERADDSELTDARRAFAAARISDYVQKVLADAPPLTAEQRDKLAELLKPARRTVRRDTLGGAA